MGLALDTIGLKDWFCETTGEVLLVFTNHLELMLGGFLAETTGALADLVCVELLDLETVGALLRFTEAGPLAVALLLWGVGGVTVVEVLRRRVLGVLDTALEWLRVAAGTDLRGVLFTFPDRCLLAVDLGLWVL